MKFKSIMKAFTLVLMLLIGLISSTGFGLTTADLTENSTSISNADSHPMVMANVASKIELKLSDSFVPDGTINLEILKTSILINEDSISKFENLKATHVNQIKFIGDVGWSYRNVKYNKEHFNYNKITKQPRDGLVATLFFIS